MSSEDDYPGGYECCASGSCEVCRGLQGALRSAAKQQRRDRTPTVDDEYDRYFIERYGW